MQKIIDKIIAAETEISIGKPEGYNAYVAKTDSVSSVSASGRTMLGEVEVRAASVMVSKGNVGERDRFIEWISCDWSEKMAYAVFKTGVTIDKEDGSSDELCWIVTLIIKETAEGWKILHRHNTRSKK
jgi:ketosteroid isomerase-like protein